jgi:hypothetical protein
MDVTFVETQELGGIPYADHRHLCTQHSYKILSQLARVLSYVEVGSNLSRDF